MDQYYSSDEEIVWGPLTLRETNKELTRPIRPDEIKIRNTTECFRPRKHEFIDDKNNQEEKNIVQEEAKLDTFQMLANNARASANIENIYQTLVENTIVLSSESEDSVIEIEDCFNKELQESNSNAHEHYSLSSVKKNSSLLINDQIILNTSKVNKQYKKHFELNDSNVDSSEEDGLLNSLSTNGKQSVSYDVNEKLMNSSYFDGKLNIYNENINHDEFKTKDSALLHTESPIKLNNSYNESFIDSEDELDCTMDMVDRILKGQLDIPKSDELFASVETSNSNKSSDFSCEKFKLTDITNREKSKIPHLIPAENKINFKIPIKPIRTKAQISNKSPIPSSKLYDHVISPVAHYIKNSPHVPLVQNVVTKTVTNLHVLKYSPKQPQGESSKGNPSDFPKIFYKPAKRTLISEKNEVHMPSTIQSLIPEKVTVIKHEKRLMNHAKLLVDENDDSIDLSMFDFSNDDISILKTKQAFLK